MRYSFFGLASLFPYFSLSLPLSFSVSVFFFALERNLLILPFWFHIYQSFSLRHARKIRMQIGWEKRGTNKKQQHTLTAWICLEWRRDICSFSFSFVGIFSNIGCCAFFLLYLIFKSRERFSNRCKKSQRKIGKLLLLYFYGLVVRRVCVLSVFVDVVAVCCCYCMGSGYPALQKIIWIENGLKAKNFCSVENFRQI